MCSCERGFQLSHDDRSCEGKSALAPGRMASISKYRGTTRYRYRTFKVSTDDWMVRFFTVSSRIGIGVGETDRCVGDPDVGIVANAVAVSAVLQT